MVEQLSNKVRSFRKTFGCVRQYGESLLKLLCANPTVVAACHGGGSTKRLRSIWTSITFFKMQADATKLCESLLKNPGIELVHHLIVHQIWCCHGNNIFTGIYSEFWIFLFWMKVFHLIRPTFTFIDHFSVFWLGLTAFWPILVAKWLLEKQNMQDSAFKMTVFLFLFWELDVNPTSCDVADLKINTSGRTM